MPLSTRIALVLPAFNEEENITEAVAEAASVLPSISPAWEVIVVNDGSSDATGAIADRLAEDYADHVHVVHHAQNRGKGAALRSGVSATTAPIVAYTDADLPFDMDALVKAHELLVETGADLVAGYRTNRERYSMQRRIYSGTYNFLVRSALGLPFDDVSFALKLMRREVFEEAALQSDGGFADVELLARVHAAGRRIERIGVAFSPRTRGESTMARPSSVLGIFRDLVLFRYRQGRRHQPAAAL